MAKRAKYISTTWEIADYDVWGNEKDGYEVNDVYRRGEIELRLKVETANAGTPQAFEYASPTDKQIREALDLRRIKIDTDGDDLVIYVNASRNGYPCGELRCVSHASLSPIREGKIEKKGN